MNLSKTPTSELLYVNFNQDAGAAAPSLRAPLDRALANVESLTAVFLALSPARPPRRPHVCCYWK